MIQPIKLPPFPAGLMDVSVRHYYTAFRGQPRGTYNGSTEADAALVRTYEDIRAYARLAVEQATAELRAELARLTTLRPYEEHAEGAKLCWARYGGEWVCDPLFVCPTHWTPLPDVKEATK